MGAIERRSSKPQGGRPHCRGRADPGDIDAQLTQLPGKNSQIRRQGHISAHDIAEAAVLLGFQEHDIPVLIAAKLRTPLGKPAPNAPKYCAAVDILNAAEDRKWRGHATRLCARCWCEKNIRKRSAVAGAAR